MDAKYYLRGADGVLRLPVDDVMKQFSYGVSARATFNREKLSNAIMVPERIESGGPTWEDLGPIVMQSPSGAPFAECDPIKVFGVSPAWLLRSYLSRRQDDSLREAVLGSKLPNVAVIRPAANPAATKKGASTTVAAILTALGQEMHTTFTLEKGGHRATSSDGRYELLVSSASVERDDNVRFHRMTYKNIIVQENAEKFLVSYVEGNPLFVCMPLEEFGRLVQLRDVRPIYVAGAPSHWNFRIVINGDAALVRCGEKRDKDAAPFYVSQHIRRLV